MVCPVIYFDSFEARKRAVYAISSVVPVLPIGIFLIITIIYSFIFVGFKNFIFKASQIIYNNNSFKLKIVQEAYRYFKNIIIDKTAYIFFKSFKTHFI